MQNASYSGKKRNPRETACTECQKRKQKCKAGNRENGPCYWCARRYPPVECVKRVNTSQIGEANNGQAAHNALQLPIQQHETSNPSHDDPHPAHFYLPTKKPCTIQLNHTFGTTLLTSANATTPFPIPPSRQNCELFHFFHQYVIPTLCSIDSSPSPANESRIVPWMMNSSLMPKIALLASVGARSQMQGVLEPARCPDALVIKGNVLSLLNRLLKENEGLENAMHAVSHLVHLEWYWGEWDSMWAHMRGLKEMLRLRGGMGRIGDEMLRWQLILTDYELAACFDQDLFLQQPQTYEHKAQPLPVPYPEVFNSPLLEFSTPFIEIRETWSLSLTAAEILDEVRAITVSILSSSLPDSDMSAKEIRTKAKDIHARILSKQLAIEGNIPQTESELITSTITEAALAYTTSISTLTPLSSTTPPSHFSSLVTRQAFYTTLWSVPLSRWKEMPGIFLWILLVACPSSGNNPHGRYLKRKMTVAALGMAVEDFDLVRACLNGFWRVGAWVRDAGGVGGEEVASGDGVFEL